MAAPRGRKPKATQLKLLQGTAEKHRLNENEPEFSRADLQPRRELSPAALEHWHKIAPVLDAGKVLTEADLDSLACYCELWATWNEATDRLRAEGMTFEDSNGNLKQSPWCYIADRAAKEMRAIATEFGMTPSSRTRVAATEKPKASRFKKLS